MSCFNSIYTCWGRLLAKQGVVVAMVDFRNSQEPSSAPEVAPFPAGLNDCISGLKWLVRNAARLRIDPKRVVAAGDSGGGNLCIALALQLSRDGEAGLLHGVYALCPFIGGKYPQKHKYPSTARNDGILLTSYTSNKQAASYGEEALRQQNPLAWPAFATPTDVQQFPRSVIVVNECDPLRDEGVAFFRLLLRAGRPARCVCIPLPLGKPMFFWLVMLCDMTHAFVFLRLMPQVPRVNGNHSRHGDICTLLLRHQRIMCPGHRGILCEAKECCIDAEVIQHITSGLDCRTKLQHTTHQSSGTLPRLGEDTSFFCCC